MIKLGMFYDIHQCTENEKMQLLVFLIAFRTLKLMPMVMAGKKLD